MQFERNIASFNNLPQEYKINKSKIKKDFKKCEIDILIINAKNNKEKYAIELKYHKKKIGEVPDFIYNCIVDMWFVKRMVEKNLIAKGFCVVVTEDKDIYNPERKVKEDMRKNYIHFKDENKNKTETETETVKPAPKDSNKLKKNDDKWKDIYIVVKKDSKSKNEYNYINTREFYTEDKNTKIVKWKDIDKNKEDEEGKYYMKEF